MEKVRKSDYSIDKDTRSLISLRYKTITKAINKEFWNSNSETDHSRYVGSYGRGTAINVSDLDILVELPYEEYEHFKFLTYNGPSRLLQAIKKAIQETYPRTEVHGDGQVVVVSFSDGMRFEVLPAFKNIKWGIWDGTFIYPDSNMGGNWLSTNPKAEQEAMARINYDSNGLLYDTCKHIRTVRANYFSSYHLSGILIDSFISKAIQGWHWLRDGEEKIYSATSYEQALLNYYRSISYNSIYAPGSGMYVDAYKDWDILGKVLYKMAA